MNLQEVIRQLGEELGIRTSVTVLILTMALLMARILPVIILSPFLGGEVVPTEVKLGVGLTLGLVLFPGLSDRMQYVPVTALPYIALLMKELFIGLSLSFIVGMVFQAALVAGTVIDTMSGTNMAQVMVPQIQQQVSLFSSLKIQLSVTLFLTLNGHHLVIGAFADSLSAIPLDQFPPMHAGAWPFFDLVLRVFHDLLRVALTLSAPAFVAVFLTDLALGMINRVAPQVQVFFVSMQIKPMATVLMVMVAMHLVLSRLVGEYRNMLLLVKDAIRLLS
ncbi:MAG: flagellar biosynthetic protein FliR [Myxococcales bacterium]|nr:flagellar biosynthetic protein FliR [Myxococcales bacterium]